MAGGTDLADLPALLRQVDVPALDEYAAVIETSSAGVLSSGQQAALRQKGVRPLSLHDVAELGSAARAAIRSGRLAERLEPLTGLVARARRAPAVNPATARDEVIDAIDDAIARARSLATPDNPVDVGLIERLKSFEADLRGSCGLRRSLRQRRRTRLMPRR